MTDPIVTPGSGGLQVRNLRKSYKKRLVIRDVSLDLARGEIVALLGPNGSGKTTTFYAIAGLLTPDTGQVLIDGRDAALGPSLGKSPRGPSSCGTQLVRRERRGPPHLC